MWVTWKVCSNEDVDVDVDFHESLEDYEIWNELMEEDQLSP